MAEEHNLLRKRSLFPTKVVKTIMLEASEEVGRVSKGVPNAVSKATELFLTDLIRSGMQLCVENGDMKLNAEHIRHVAETKERFDFLATVLDESKSSYDSNASASLKRNPSKSKQTKENNDINSLEESELSDVSSES